MKKPQPASARFSMFRSWARDITAEAREAKKFGFSTDTNGKLARAIEKGYKMGFEDAQKKDNHDHLGGLSEGKPAPKDAKHYNRRVQAVLHVIGLRNNGTEDRFDPTLGPRAFYCQDEFHRSPISDKPPQWRMVEPGRYDDDTFEDSTIAQTVKKGLLKYARLTNGPLEGRRVAYLTSEGVDAYRQLFIDPYRRQSHQELKWTFPDD